jgi:L-ascorbate metabolism protein UlaG (beta-lactamase superfamily)
MKIQKLGHSCLLIEKDGSRILIDPGSSVFVGPGFDPASVVGLTAILITHEHMDHADASAIKTLQERNANVLIMSNAGVKAFLEKEGIAVELFESGERSIGSFFVEAVPAAHGALIVPTPPNTAYIIDKQLLITGDSLNDSLISHPGVKGIEVLALPIFAPWMKQPEAAEFGKQIKPKIIIPVHEGVVISVFAQRLSGMWQKYFGDMGVEFKNLTPTESLEV